VCTLSLGGLWPSELLSRIDELSFQQDRLHAQLGIHMFADDNALSLALLDGYRAVGLRLAAFVDEARNAGLLLHVGVVQ
jgi:hypothetical protein